MRLALGCNVSEKENEVWKLGHILLTLIGFTVFSAFGFELIQGVLGEDIEFSSLKYGVSTQGLPAVVMVSAICIAGLALCIVGIRGVFRK